MPFSRKINLAVLLIIVTLNLVAATRIHSISSQILSNPCISAPKSTKKIGDFVHLVNYKRMSSPQVFEIRGGATSAAKDVPKKSLRQTVVKNLLAGWGVFQVLSILANALKRLIPIAIQPIVQKDLPPAQVAMCIGWCAYMAYVEGYQAFQKKFSPLVVKRAFGLSENPSILKVLLAGPYCMGLFGATKKRMIVSWSVTVGVVALVQAVKKLPYPWRSIVDAGVVVGLSYGALSMCWQTVGGMLGSVPDVDECLPGSDKKDKEGTDKKKA